MPRAWADDCARPNLIESLPRAKDGFVAPNAQPYARYAATAEYLGEAVKVTGPGGETVSVEGDWDPSQGILTLKPSQPFSAEGRYGIAWPALRGRMTDAGRGLQTTFSVTATLDAENPAFAGIAAVTWDHDRRTNDCTDALESRLAFDLSFGDARDDGGRENLSVVVFQTRGPKLGANPKQVTTAVLPNVGRDLRVSLAVDDAVGDLCFAALVRDLAGHTSASADKEICVKTVAPPFFSGCAVAPGRAAPLPWLVLLPGLFVGLRRRRG